VSRTKGPPESTIVSGILTALSYRRDVKVWRQNTGAARLPGRGGELALVRFGRPGAADISGLVVGSGRRLEIEVKRPGGKQSEAQEQYEREIRNAGGIYLLAHSVEECLSALSAELEVES
jgi:hypothetical protein